MSMRTVRPLLCGTVCRGCWCLVQEPAGLRRCSLSSQFCWPLYFEICPPPSASGRVHAHSSPSNSSGCAPQTTTRHPGGGGGKALCNAGRCAVLRLSQNGASSRNVMRPTRDIHAPTNDLLHCSPRWTPACACVRVLGGWGGMIQLPRGQASAQWQISPFFGGGGGAQRPKTKYVYLQSIHFRAPFTDFTFS